MAQLTLNVKFVKDDKAIWRKNYPNGEVGFQMVKIRGNNHTNNVDGSTSVQNGGVAGPKTFYDVFVWNGYLNNQIIPDVPEDQLLTKEEFDALYTGF